MIAIASSFLKTLRQSTNPFDEGLQVFESFRSHQLGNWRTEHFETVVLSISRFLVVVLVLVVVLAVAAAALPYLPDFVVVAMRRALVDMDGPPICCCC